MFVLYRCSEIDSEAFWGTHSQFEKGNLRRQTHFSQFYLSCEVKVGVWCVWNILLLCVYYIPLVMRVNIELLRKLNIFKGGGGVKIWCLVVGGINYI